MIRLYFRMLSANLRAQMQYKANFIAGVVGMIFSYAAQFINLNLMVGRFSDLNGWKLQEVVFLLALSIMAWGLCQSFFAVFAEIGYTMVKGDFDRFLLRPVNPFLLYAGTQKPLNAIGQLLFSGWAFWWVSGQIDLHLTALKWLYLMLTVAGGGLILGAAMLAVGAAAFWTTRSESLYWTVVIPARQLAWYPIHIYRLPIQLVLTFVLPFAFINYFPAHYLLDRTGPVLFHPLFPYLTPLVGVMAFAGAYGLWTLGLRRYAGTGS